MARRLVALLQIPPAWTGQEAMVTIEAEWVRQQRATARLHEKETEMEETRPGWRKISVPTAHPTNPNMDGWETRWEPDPDFSSTKPEREGREGDSQAMPTPNEHQDIQSQVIADITARREVGISRYGTALQPFNGRSALVDAYEETLDLACYLKQKIVEEQQAEAAMSKDPEEGPWPEGPLRPDWP